jgi:hypothetical protein
MSTTVKILIALGFIALLAFIIYSSAGLAQVTCEVCVEFRGQTSCKSASGTTREEALRTAQDVACAQVASGRDDSITCTQLTQPKSFTCK